MAARFRARFRFRVGKKLNLGSRDEKFVIGDHEVVLSAGSPETSIMDSEWLIMNAYGFDSDDAARAFAARLKTGTEAAAVVTRIGVNAGRDLPTSGLGRLVRDQVLAEQGIDIRDNVHGIDVFADEPSVLFLNASAKPTLLVDPRTFLSGIDSVLHAPSDISDRTRDVILLMNYALMRPDAVAQVIFSISAVEMLGQDQQWSDSQRQLLERLRTIAISSDIGLEAERNEVAEAIKRGTQKLSLRQGVFRLLESLQLGSLRRAWDAIYSDRSELVHGLAPRPGADYTNLATRTVSLCGRVLLKFIAQELPYAGTHIDEYYPNI